MDSGLDRQQEIIDRLQGLRDELHALRESVEGTHRREALDLKVSELEIEQKLAAIEDEIARPPKKRRGWFERR